MYGVSNNGLNNIPTGCGGYGKTNSFRNMPESNNTVENVYTNRTDQILFSAVQQTEGEAYSKLSDKAKTYLTDLKKKYPGYSFMVADYETDEEAGRLLAEGKGKINVLITPDLLEKMASDENVRTKYEGIIDGAADQLADITNKLTDGGKSIIESLGLTVNDDGTTSVYAFLTQGITNSDGSKVVKSSLISDFTETLNSIAENNQKLTQKENQHAKTPAEKEKEIRNSVLPPKSFEKYKKEPSPYSTEEDYGSLPPESFKKYEKTDDEIKKDDHETQMNFKV